MGRRPDANAANGIKTDNRSDVVLYRAPEGGAALEVRIEKDTVWLTQKQMARLFGKDSDTIGLHIRNAYKEKELEERATTEESSVVRREGNRTVRRSIRHYNLDVIISVGYRVKSKRGTQFRIWATRVLREYVFKGYAANEQRLKALRQSLKLVGKVLNGYDITADETKALLHVVTDYSRALDILDDYDHRRVAKAKGRIAPARGIDYEEARRVVERMRSMFGASQLFGREKDESLRGSLTAVMQTFGGKDLYPSLEEKAANLLYFLVKNHSFVDGNKRIAASLFLWFMEKNGFLYRDDGSKRVADNALVAITLMIAESDPREKDAVVNLTMNLIGGIA